MNKKYVDTTAIVQVIGNIYNNISLLDNEEYNFHEEDFTEEFHKILFGSIFNLHALGAKQVTPAAIEDYLEQRPKKLAVYKVNKGPEYLQNLSEVVQLSTFDYYYKRMKKMTLLRMYSGIVNVSTLYDPDNILDVKKKQAQEDWLDNTSLEEIADVIDKKITDIRLKYVDDDNGVAINAGDGALSLLEKLKETPEIGYPLYGPLINTVTRGARLKKFYLWSAATGVGKTRNMIANACSIGCNQLYDSESKDWKDNGTREPVLFISTEQELEEVQTMMLAFISDVDEEHIINGDYFAGEWERVIKAAEILKESSIYVQQLPDFSLQDIENTIKREIREHNVRYIFHDYIHTSMKILEEITKRSGGVKLREDNILFMISIRLKDICNQYGVFIMTATQLNADYVEAGTPDQNLLRGAKSIADKIDFGAIMLEVTQKDRESLTEVVSKGGYEMPAIKISIYKNRRGRWKGIYLWCKANRGTCKITPMFATDYQYKFIEMQDLKINIKPRQDASAF